MTRGESGTDWREAPAAKQSRFHLSQPPSVPTILAVRIASKEMRVVAEIYFPERIAPNSLSSPTATNFPTPVCKPSYSLPAVPACVKTASVGDVPPTPGGKVLKPKKSSATPCLPVHTEPRKLPTTSVSPSSATVTSVLSRAPPRSPVLPGQTNGLCHVMPLDADVAIEIGMAATLRVPRLEVLSSCDAERVIASMDAYYDKANEYIRTIIATRSENT